MLLCVNPWGALPRGPARPGAGSVRGAYRRQWGARTGSGGVEGLLALWSQHAPSRPRQSGIDELSLCEGKTLGTMRSIGGPRQSRENMKQVSVRPIFGSSTHHPCPIELGREIATSHPVPASQRAGHGLWDGPSDGYGVAWMDGARSRPPPRPPSPLPLQPEPERVQGLQGEEDAIGGCEWLQGTKPHRFGPVWVRCESTGARAIPVWGVSSRACAVEMANGAREIGCFSNRSCTGGTAGFHAAGHAGGGGYLLAGWGTSWEGRGRGCSRGIHGIHDTHGRVVRRRGFRKAGVLRPQTTVWASISAVR